MHGIVMVKLAIEMVVNFFILSKTYLVRSVISEGS